MVIDQTKITILGARGQLGLALAKYYPQARAVDLAELNIAKTAALESYPWPRRGIIINAAAYTNVDGAETPEGKELAWQVNARAVEQLAQIALQTESTLVHISTDYVFDGTKSPHDEDEPYSPLGVYGTTKAVGDKAVEAVSKHYLIRTSWVIGQGKNFVRTMLDLTKQNVSPKVVADQTGRPTFTSQLVDAIDHLLTDEAPFGTYNVSNSGPVVSWADFARAIFQANGNNEVSVKNITSDEYATTKPEAAPRPRHSEFDLTKIKATGLKLRDWPDDLKTYLDS